MCYKLSVAVLLIGSTCHCLFTPNLSLPCVSWGSSNRAHTSAPPRTHTMFILCVQVGLRTTSCHSGSWFQPTLSVLQLPQEKEMQICRLSRGSADPDDWQPKWQGFFQPWIFISLLSLCMHLFILSALPRGLTKLISSLNVHHWSPFSSKQRSFQTLRNLWIIYLKYRNKMYIIFIFIFFPKQSYT